MAGSPKAAANVIISRNSLDCMRAGEDCSFTGRRRRVAVARAFARLSLSRALLRVRESHNILSLSLSLVLLQFGLLCVSRGVCTRCR